MKKLGIYVRVSTEEQAKKGISLGDQTKRGIDLATELNVPYEVFEDKGISGTVAIDKRKGLDTLMGKIYSEEIDGLYVTDFDRLTRDTFQSQMLKKEFLDYKVEVYTVSGLVSLDDENQALLYDLRNLLASFEIKKTSTRIKRNLQRNAIEGKVAGGPFQPYGYLKGPDKMLMINEAEAKVVRMIYQYSLEGKGTRQIANLLDEQKIPTKRSTEKKGQITIRGELRKTFRWNDGTIYGILTNSIYKGERKFTDLVIPCPIIIEPAIFDLVQQQLKSKSRFVNTTNKYDYLLKGLIRCTCGRLFYGHKRANNNDSTYVCGSNRQRGGFCGTKGINIAYLEKLVLNQILTLPEQVDNFFEYYQKANGTEKVQNEIFKIEVEITKKENRLAAFVEMRADGSIDKKTFDTSYKKTTDELNELKAKKDELTPQLSILDNKAKIKKMVQTHINNLEKKGIKFDEKLKIVRALVSHINIVWNPSVKIPFVGSADIFGKYVHFISISYKIDAMTEIKMSKEISLGYQKAGGSYRNSKILQNELRINLETFEASNEVDKFSVVKSRVTKVGAMK